MKRSITAGFLKTALVVMLAALLLHIIYRNVGFELIYQAGIHSTYQGELDMSTLLFVGGSDNTIDYDLQLYFEETGSPVAVITEDYTLADRQWPEQFNYILVKTDEEQFIRLALFFVPRTDWVQFEAGRRVEFTAVRLGESSYYEAVTLRLGETEYINTSLSDQLLAEAAESLTAQGDIISRRPSAVTDVTLLMYQHLSRCLILRTDLPGYLDQLSGQTIVAEDGGIYRFFYSTRSFSGHTYYFITAHPFPYTGREHTYLNRFFWGSYAIFALVLLAGALVLSRRMVGPLRHLIGVTKRITDLDFGAQPRLRSEDELGVLSGNIDAMSRSLETALNELKESTRKASANEERMKLLLSDLAHEFKTPLGIIASHFEVMHKGYHEGAVDEYLDVLDGEINLLSEMVNEVIELSKLQTGNWRIDIGSWDLSEIADMVRQKFAAQFEKDGFEVTIDVEEVLVRVDIRRIEQVFTNLISNALKYSDHRRQIRISSVPDSDGEVMVYVRNSGHLSDDARGRIWDRYYSTGDTTKARLPSEGIGLDIVKTILVSHGSRYGVIQEGGMVCFYFSLETDGEPLIMDNQ